MNKNKSMEVIERFKSMLNENIFEPGAIEEAMNHIGSLPKDALNSLKESLDVALDVKQEELNEETHDKLSTLREAIAKKQEPEEALEDSSTEPTNPSQDETPTTEPPAVPPKQQKEGFLAKQRRFFTDPSVTTSQKIVRGLQIGSGAYLAVVVGSAGLGALKSVFNWIRGKASPPPEEKRTIVGTVLRYTGLAFLATFALGMFGDTEASGSETTSKPKPQKGETPQTDESSTKEETKNAPKYESDTTEPEQETDRETSDDTLDIANIPIGTSFMQRKKVKVGDAEYVVRVTPSGIEVDGTVFTVTKKAEGFTQTIGAGADGEFALTFSSAVWGVVQTDSGSENGLQLGGKADAYSIPEGTGLPASSIPEILKKASGGQGFSLDAFTFAT